MGIWLRSLSQQLLGGHGVRARSPGSSPPEAAAPTAHGPATAASQVCRSLVSEISARWRSLTPTPSPEQPGSRCQGQEGPSPGEGAVGLGEEGPKHGLCPETCLMVPCPALGTL